MSNFDLEQAIKKWRKELQKQPGLEPGYIEELEAHLRDKADDLTANGLPAREAFQRAVQQLEDAEDIAIEFHRARSKVPVKPAWKSASWVPSLLPNFLKVTLRNFQRKKGYAFINIFGLAVGLAACLLMVLYIHFQLSFDQFHTKKDRIYRVDTNRNITNGWPIGLILGSEYPEIQDVVYLRQWPRYSIKKDNRYYFPNSLIASQSFLEVFNFRLVEGDRKTALSKPGQLIITRDMEKKFFDDQPALGKTLILQDSLSFTVSGVMENVPKNSHIQFDMLVSFPSWSTQQSSFNTNSHWYDWNMYNYILVKKGTDVQALQKKVENIYMDKAGDYFRSVGAKPQVKLEPMTDIYLYSFGNGLGPISNINYLYLLGGIAGFILLIACINFMNLATARSIERAKEVGIRKVVGSTRQTLIGQFLTESALTALLGMILAAGLAFWALPYFNELTGASFHYSDLISMQMGVALLAFISLVGFLAGLYPAFVLSDFKPVQVLKESFTNTGRGAWLRKVLVTFQFTVSCFLIICTIVIVKQLRFMQNQNLGFDKQQIAVMDVRRAAGSIRPEQYKTIKQQLEESPAIRQVTATLATPGRNGWRSILTYGQGQHKDQAATVEYLPVDFDYIPTFGLKVIAGRAFSKDRPMDTRKGVVINEAAVKQFGWNSPEEAIGKHVITLNSLLDDPVIGVVKNYHQHGLQEQIQPLVMVIDPLRYNYYAVKFDAAHTDEMLNQMKKVWTQFFPGYTFQYFFLDADYARQYDQQRQLAKIYGTFSTLAILIACLGLFGLTAFATAKRTKEIGIRKVLGASVPNIFLLISKDFILLIAVGFLIASPAAFWFMTNWLNDFAFKTSIGIWVFGLTALIGLLITILTISWQSVKAASQNPVKSLRSE